MNNQWKPNSWKDKPAKHLPTYKDVKSLELITKKLSNYPIYVLPIKVNFCYNKNKFFYKTDSYLNLYKTND